MIRLLVHLGSAAPLVFILVQLLTRMLGPDPGEPLVRFLGEAAVVFLLMSLAVTPLVKTRPSFKRLMLYRRAVGLWAFAYALLHALGFWGLYLGWYWGDLVSELVERPYIVVGFIALLILLVLALTSPKVVMRKLGGRRWRFAHRFVYVAVLLAMVHYFWQLRSFAGEWLVYVAITALLLGWRVMYHWRSSKGRV